MGIKLTSEVDFEIGDVVFCKTDPEQKERLVIGINYNGHCLSYTCSFCDFEHDFYGIELSKEKDVLKSLL